MKNIFKTCAIFWEKAHCVYTVVKTATKRPPSLATPQLDEVTYPHRDPHYFKHKGMKFQMTRPKLGSSLWFSQTLQPTEGCRTQYFLLAPIY